MRQPSLAATRLAEDSRRGRRAKSERSSPPCAPEALRSARILTRSPPGSPPRAQVDEVRDSPDGLACKLTSSPPTRPHPPPRTVFASPRPPPPTPRAGSRTRSARRGPGGAHERTVWFARRVDRSGRGEDRRQSARPPPSARRSRPARCARTPRPANRTLGFGRTPRHARARARQRARAHPSTIAPPTTGRTAKPPGAPCSYASSSES